MRDVQLDCYRALTMIYIVCVIHVLYWYWFQFETLCSLALFEMPLIFFIAGASQSYGGIKNFKRTIINRSKRVLVPYYIFVIFLLAFFYVCSVMNINFEGESIDLTLLGITGIIKILATGGSVHIPYFGYTWFISCYLIISCSLPLQQRIIAKYPKHLYIIVMAGLFLLCRITDTQSFENILENVLLYNFFYILGYLYYNKIGPKHIIAIGIIPMVVSLYWFIHGEAIPMYRHKFPPDAIFMIYCFCVLCLLGAVLGKIKIKYNYILKLWNDRGYTIYLYQSISHFMVYKLTDGWRTAVGNEPLVFIVSSLLVFIFATALSYITVPMEKYIISKVFPKNNKI